MWVAPPQAGLVIAAPRRGDGEALACAQAPIALADCAPDDVYGHDAFGESASGGGALGKSAYGLETSQVAQAGLWHDAKALEAAPVADEQAWPHVAFNLAVVSDYRRAGVSKSKNRPALQGGVDVTLPAHWNTGARFSTIAEHGNSEVVLYGAKSIEVGETELSFGVSTLLYPRAPQADYAFVQASASRAIGPVDATFAVNYAPSQGNLNHRDNLYLVGRARTPIGSFFGLPVTLAASLGRMRGRFAMAHVRSDWSLGLASRIHNCDVGITYVDNDLSGARGDPAIVLSLAHSF